MNDDIVKQAGRFMKGFLILKRGAGQGLIIGDDTEIVVTKVENGSVFLAIKSPQKVLRKELAGKPPRDKKKDAAQATPLQDATVTLA